MNKQGLFCNGSPLSLRPMQSGWAVCKEADVTLLK
jgi:hypothetical protein